MTDNNDIGTGDFSIAFYTDLKETKILGTPIVKTNPVVESTAPGKWHHVIVPIERVIRLRPMAAHQYTRCVICGKRFDTPRENRLCFKCRAEFEKIVGELEK